MASRRGTRNELSFLKGFNEIEEGIKGRKE